MKKNRPTGLKYQIKRINPTWIRKGQHLSIDTEIKKGQRLNSKTEIKTGQHFSFNTEFKLGGIPWNKGRKGLQKNHNTEGLKLGRGMLKGKKRPEFSGELHPSWKGGIERLKFLKKRRRVLEKLASGSHTHEEWKELVKFYGYMCLCCKRIDIVLTEDHIIPLSKGGTDYIENIQPLCVSCNSRKRVNITDYREGRVFLSVL